MLGAAAALVPAAAAKAADDAQGVASSRMSYSRFLEYLDMGRVKKVRCCCCVCNDTIAAVVW
jgi:cell division protease FtsH